MLKPLSLILSRILLPVTIIVTTSITYIAYKRSAELSKFEIAAEALELNLPIQQEALLKIFYLAGYFEPQRLWQDLLCFDQDKATKIFSLMQRSLVKAGIDQNNFDKFNAKSLRKNLFKDTNEVSIQDVEDLLLFIRPLA